MAKTMRHRRLELQAMGIPGAEASAKTVTGREKLSKMRTSANNNPLMGEALAMAVAPPSKTVVLSADKKCY